METPKTNESHTNGLQCLVFLCMFFKKYTGLEFPQRMNYGQIKSVSGSKYFCK